MTSHRASSTARSGAEPTQGPATRGQTHYELLEVAPDASATELRQAFRNLSKRFHPDTTSLPAEQARDAFARLRQAYAVLADPASRRAYDATLQPTPLMPPSPGPAAAARPIGVRRSLSGGEWFALVLLALALALSLVLGFGLAWARGAALITRPSWWSDAVAEVPVVSAPADGPQRNPAADSSLAAMSPSGPADPASIRQAP